MNEQGRVRADVGKWGNQLRPDRPPKGAEVADLNLRPHCRHPQPQLQVKTPLRPTRFGGRTRFAEVHRHGICHAGVGGCVSRRGALDPPPSPKTAAHPA
jgi:hypothetical protein